MNYLMLVGVSRPPANGMVFELFKSVIGNELRPFSLR